MISRLFLASGAAIAATQDAGSMETIKNVLLIAFLAVGILWLLLESRRNLMAAYGDVGASAAPATPAPAALRPAPATALSPELVAVLSAAVHATLGRNSRVVAISTDDDAQTWAAEGRRAIYATRKVR